MMRWNLAGAVCACADFIRTGTTELRYTSGIASVPDVNVKLFAEREFTARADVDLSTACVEHCMTE